MAEKNTANDMSLETMLGEGIFSKVYLKNNFGTPLALKKFRPEVPPEAVEKEALVLESFDDPGIPEVVAYSPEERYIIMSFAPNQDLTDYLLKKGRKDHTYVKSILTIGSQILRILEVVHEQGYIHGDIRPDNVRVNVQEKGIEGVSIVDFGRTIAPDQIQDGIVPISHVIYRAPETHQEIGGFNADIYSLGCTLLHALRGKTFFSEMIESWMELVNAKSRDALIKDQLEKTCRHYRSLATPLKALLQPMLVFDPWDRPDTETTKYLLDTTLASLS